MRILLIVLIAISFLGCAHIHTTDEYMVVSGIDDKGDYYTNFNVLRERGRMIYWWEKDYKIGGDH